jgi:hypothetical protein
MTRIIGGTLNAAALARLHFNVLDQDAKASAIRRLAASGQTDTTIAAATGLSVEMIRSILVNPEEGAT